MHSTNAKNHVIRKHGFPKAGRIQQQQKQVGKAGSTSQHTKRRQAEKQVQTHRMPAEDLIQIRSSKTIWDTSSNTNGSGQVDTQVQKKLEGQCSNLWWQTNPFNDTALHDPKCSTDNQILAWTNCQCKCRPVASQHFFSLQRMEAQKFFCAKTLIRGPMNLRLIVATKKKKKPSPYVSKHQHGQEINRTCPRPGCGNLTLETTGRIGDPRAEAMALVLVDSSRGPTQGNWMRTDAPNRKGLIFWIKIAKMQNINMTQWHTLEG